MFNSFGSPALNDVVFEVNSVTGPSHPGGGMYNNGGSPTLTNVTFSGNSSTGTGGGLHNFNGGSTLTNVTFIGNTSADGGGMYSDGGSPTLMEVTFRLNSATDEGGGMSAEGDSTTLINVIFDSNSAARGGGLRAGPGKGALTNAIFDSNSANTGGGVELAGVGGVWIVTNATFSGNYASIAGGALHYLSTESPQIINTIMWGDDAPSGPEIRGRATAARPVVSYSLIEGCGGSGAGWISSNGIDGGNNIDTDPFLKGSDFPDTPLALYSSSPALNAGDNFAVPGTITTDIEGSPRVFGSSVDMGAYEYQGLVTGIEDDTDSRLPTAMAIKGAYPNPFNPAVTVEFDLDRRRDVEVSIYDVQGKLVRRLVSENRDRGTHRVRWEGNDDRGNRVASGVYLLLVRSEGWADNRKLVLLK